MPQNLPKFLLGPQPAVHAAGTICYAVEKGVLEYINCNVQDGTYTLETGCGLSTILFAYLGCKHICISPNKEEHERIVAFCQEERISIKEVTFIEGFSQDILPHLKCTQLDLVLIDGGHGFPIPFVDWLYAARKLKVGGRLIVDDTQLWTGHVLRDFLMAERAWQFEKSFHKAIAFKKILDNIEKDWGGQPYVVVRSALRTDWPFQRNIIWGHLVGLREAVGRFGDNRDVIANKELGHLAEELRLLAVELESQTKCVKK